MGLTCSQYRSDPLLFSGKNQAIFFTSKYHYREESFFHTKTSYNSSISFILTKSRPCSSSKIPFIEEIALQVSTNKLLSSLALEFDSIVCIINSQLFHGISTHILKKLHTVLPRRMQILNLHPPKNPPSCSTYFLQPTSDTGFVKQMMTG